MHDYYNLSQTLQGSIFAALFRLRQQSGEQSAPPPALFQAQGGYAESPAWYMVQAIEFDPEPLTVAKLRVRDIYASERIVAALLDLLTAAGMLDRSLQNAYQLTTAGRQTIDKLMNRSVKPLAALGEMLTTDSGRLADLLGRVTVSWLADTERDSWCLAHSRNRAPADDASALGRISHFCADFNAYRDDAHMASWRQHNVMGIEWETFSFVHDEQANSAEKLFELLAHRGYATAEFAQILDNLGQRSWVVDDGGSYAATALGATVRQAAETDTNSYFYAAWKDEAVGSELWSLMNALNDELQTIAA